MKKIDAVEIVRKIRDKQNKETQNKSHKEIIDYFSKKAKKFTEKVKVLELSEH